MPINRLLHERPIGVFDSGLGGLTVVKEIRKQLPHEKIIYFGDIARLPYGIKSKGQIIQYSKENTQFLAQYKIKALVVACNSSASVCLPALKKFFKYPIIDVIEPASEQAVSQTRTHRIGVIGTTATIESGNYPRAIHRRSKKTKVFSQACPLLVPLVEEGWAWNGVSEHTIEKYLTPLVRRKVDVIILGCTHYPLLKNKIQKFVGRKVTLIDSAVPTVARLRKILTSQNGLVKKTRSSKGLRIYVSDFPRNFVRIGERFLGKKMHHVKVVKI